MKRLLLILMFLLPALAFGQKHAYFGTPTTIDSFNLTMWVRQFKMPRVPLVNPYFDSVGSVYLNTTTGTIYFHDGGGWQPIAGGGGGGGLQHAGPWLTVANDTVYFDTVKRLDYVLANTDLKVPTAKTVRTALGDTSLNLRAVFAADLADSMEVARDSVVKRVPYRYANDTVLLGEYPIRAGQFRFDLTPTMPTVVGGMYWDTGNVTASLPLNADVNLQIGQESLVRARNNTGSTVTNGQVVYISGAQGNNPTIALADADSASTSQVIGVATEDIGINATGFVTVSGVVNNVNTSAWNAGDKLYLSTTNGQLTNTPPTPPHISVMVGTALNSTNNGRIFVSPSQPIATDTNLLNGTNVPPTQYAVKSYVQSQGYGTGTVTSVGSGFGLTGGAITTTGTLRVDSTNVPTQYRVDTTAANALTRINTKGSVSSVALANGFGLSISGSPVTGTGTITATVDTTKVATKADVNAKGNGTVTFIQLVAGTGVSITPTTAVTTSGTYTISATGSTGVQSVTSTGSTAIISGTTTVNVEVDTTHPFTFTGNNTFTRDITIDSATFGTGNGLSTNIKIGRSALAAPTTATGIVAIGENAGRLVTTGQNDIYIGRNAAGNSGTGVSGHVGIGTGNLNYSTGDNNTAIGFNVMARAVAWNGIANVGVGINAGNVMTSASSNTFVGSGTAAALTSGSSNTFLGVSSGSAMTTGGSNVILGGYTGNAGGLDIRTLSNRMVLSDGAGNIRAYHTGTNWLIGTVTDGSTGILQLSGNLGLNTAGNKINIATGSQASVGTGTLATGTATVLTTAVTASSIIQVQLTSCSSCGTLYISAQLAGTSFTVTSTNGSDASTFNYWIIN